MTTINLNHVQQNLAKRFKNISLSINSQNILTKISQFLFQDKTAKGIYLYGDVGRGKTMLMQKFYVDVKVSKNILHYQQLMQDVHKKLNKLYNSHTTDRLIQDIGDDIIKSTKVLCIDEFEINDIADAMIILCLFHHLIKNNVFIFVTTNTAPDNLYKNGLQRNAFLPFISELKANFDIIFLDSNKDYRFANIAKLANRIFFLENKQIMNNIKSKICNKQLLSKISLNVFGRELLFYKAYKDILLTDFSELFIRSLGYNDYIKIAKEFNVIVVSSVRKIMENETDIATRFINFIDNAYFHNVLLFMEIECKPDELYEQGKKKPEFNRVISRLNEMNFKNYPNINHEQP